MLVFDLQSVVTSEPCNRSTELSKSDLDVDDSALVLHRACIVQDLDSCIHVVEISLNHFLFLQEFFLVVVQVGLNAL